MQRRLEVVRKVLQKRHCLLKNSVTRPITIRMLRWRGSRGSEHWWAADWLWAANLLSSAPLPVAHHHPAVAQPSIPFIFGWFKKKNNSSARFSLATMMIEQVGKFPPLGAGRVPGKGDPLPSWCTIATTTQPNNHLQPFVHLAAYERTEYRVHINVYKVNCTPSFPFQCMYTYKSTSKVHL